jgi:hypothetical protein
MVLVSEENLETSMDDSERVTMYTAAGHIGIIGHAYIIERRDKDVVVSRMLCVCEGMIADVAPAMMPKSMLSTYGPAFKWIVGDKPGIVAPIKPPTKLIYRTAMCYAEDTPLTLYTNLAVIVAQNHSDNSRFCSRCQPCRRFRPSVLPRARFCRT